MGYADLPIGYSPQMISLRMISSMISIFDGMHLRILTAFNRPTPIGRPK